MAEFIVTLSVLALCFCAAVTIVSLLAGMIFTVVRRLSWVS